MSVVDDYFDSLDSGTRSAFAHIRALAMEVVPDAEDGTSYGMAALKYARKPLLGFRAAKDHLSVFPFSPAVVAAVGGDLEGFDLSKGTIRFSAATPLPDTVVREIVRLRRDEIAKPPRSAELTRSAKPTQGTEPTRSVKPTQGSKPTRSAKPTQGSKPTRSAKPTQGSKPTRSAKPAQGSKPAG